MSIQDLMLALGPWFYYPLNDAPGSILHDVSGHGINITNVDATGLGAVGPEIGSTAWRVFSGDIAIGPALSLTSWGDMSWIWWLTAPRQNPDGDNKLFGIGDHSQTSARGITVSMNTGSQQHMSSRIGGTSGFGWGGNAPQDAANLWHVYAWTWQQSNSQAYFWVDGVQTSSQGFGVGTAPLTTDPFWIQSPYPSVLAHIAMYTKVLTPAQVQTVTAPILQWPYGEPINVPVVGQSTTVDLTPVLTDTAQILANQQTTDPIITTQIPAIATTTTTIENQNNTIGQQTTTIQTDTHNIVNSLFPQLADAINAILGAVTATISGVGGAISTTLGNLFSGRTFDLLTLIHLGSACAPDVINADLTGLIIYGIQMEATTIPDYTTFTGWGEDYTQKSLGTLIIYRGGQIILRRGLHNQTEMVYPLPGVPFFEYEIALPQAPGDYNVVLEPAPGTCWTLSGLSLP